jgi:hypothetical protein
MYDAKGKHPAMSASAAQSHPLPAPASRWLAAFCAVAIWLLGLLNVSPQLHAPLHHDCDEANHTCAITLFSHGAETTAVQVDLIFTPRLIFKGLVRSPLTLLRVTADRLPPTCGPPLC